MSLCTYRSVCTGACMSVCAYCITCAHTHDPPTNEKACKVNLCSFNFKYQQILSAYD